MWSFEKLTAPSIFKSCRTGSLVSSMAGTLLTNQIGSGVTFQPTSELKFSTKLLLKRKKSILDSTYI